MSFGLDALDGKSIICKSSEGENTHQGFRFVGHRVIRDTFNRERSTVTPSEFDWKIDQEYGMAILEESLHDHDQVDLITDFYIEFWTFKTFLYDYKYRLNRETLELVWFEDGEKVDSATTTCRVYTNTDAYWSAMEEERKYIEDTYSERLKNRKI